VGGSREGAFISKSGGNLPERPSGPSFAESGVLIWKWRLAERDAFEKKKGSLKEPGRKRKGKCTAVVPTRVPDDGFCRKRLALGGEQVG